MCHRCFEAVIGFESVLAPVWALYCLSFVVSQEAARDFQRVEPALPDAPPVELPPLPTEFPPLPDIRPLQIEQVSSRPSHAIPQGPDTVSTLGAMAVVTGIDADPYAGHGRHSCQKSCRRGCAWTG